MSGLLRGHSNSRSTDIAIAFQTGSAVGLVRLRVRGRVSGANSILVNYAKELAVRLGRVLTLSGMGADG